MTETLTPTLVWTVIIGMAITNFAFRFIPMSILSRVKLPDSVMRWLEFIPISVMGALFAKQILLPAFEEVSSTPLIVNPGIIGGISAMIAYKITKSFMLSSIAGVVVFVLARTLISNF
jgi:branched-subunit amino acid transport protein